MPTRQMIVDFAATSTGSRALFDRTTLDFVTFVNPTECARARGPGLGADSITGRVPSRRTGTPGPTLYIFGNPGRTGDGDPADLRGRPGPDTVRSPATSTPTTATIEVYAAHLGRRRRRRSNDRRGMDHLPRARSGSRSPRTSRRSSSRDRHVSITSATAPVLGRPASSSSRRPRTAASPSSSGEQEVANFVIDPLPACSRARRAPGEAAGEVLDRDHHHRGGRAADRRRHRRHLRDRVGERERHGQREPLQPRLRAGDGDRHRRHQPGVVITSTAAIVITRRRRATASMSSSTARSSTARRTRARRRSPSRSRSATRSPPRTSRSPRAPYRRRQDREHLAGGNIDSEAAAESGIFADGTAGLAFAIELSDADITRRSSAR